MNNRSIAAHLKVSPQCWLDACAADVSKKMTAIEALDLQTPFDPNPDPQAEWLQEVLPRLAPHHQLLMRQHWIEGVQLRDLVQSHRLSQRRLKLMIQDAIKALQLLAVQDGLLTLPRPSPTQQPEAFAAH